MRSLIALFFAAVVLIVGIWLTGGFDTAPDFEPEPSVPEGRGPEPAPAESKPGIRLLASDHRTPAASREIKLFRRPARRMELPKLVDSARTDADGHVAFGELEPGEYIACVPGARPGDRSPRTVTWTEPQATPSTRYLIADADVETVTFDLQAQFTPRFGVTSKVFFVRRDDLSGCYHELPDIVLPGAAEVQLELPAGRYEVSTWPQGELIVKPSSRELTVDGPTRHTVQLTQHQEQIQVQLQGLAETAFPARVYAQPANVVLDDRSDRLRWGNSRWHQSAANVPVLEGERRLLLFGRETCARSTETHVFDRDITVRMEPATRVIVDWYSWGEGESDAMLVLEAGGDAIARRAAPQFGAARPGLDRPSLGGELVGPRGASARIECRLADGTLAWERELVLERAEARVEIE